MSKPLKNQLFWIILIVLLSLIAIYPFFREGFYSLHDDLHVVWLYEMDRAVRSGQLPPRWVPDLSFGYGYPLFNFVYPLPFYLGEFFHLAGLSLVASIKAVFIFSIVSSAVTMFLFLKRHFSYLFASLGGLLYVYSPYRAVEIFVRGAIGEALVFVFLPLVAFFLDKTCRRNQLGDEIGAGISIALLILTHNIGAVMSLPFLFLYGMTVLLREGWDKKGFLSLLRSFVFGGLLSLFFWMPALFERKFMIVDTVFNFKDHFPFVRQLILPSWGYGGSVWGPGDGMSFQIGIMNLFSVFVSMVVLSYFLYKRRIKKILFFLWAWFIFIISFFLMNIRSSFVWNAIPLLPFFQFPWRFLILVVFSTSILFCSIERLPVFSAKNKNIVGIGLLVLTIFLVVPYFKPDKVFTARTDAYFLQRYLPNRDKYGYTETVSPEYLDIKEEYLRLPVWTQQRPSSLPAKKIEAAKGKISFIERTPTFFEGRIKNLETTVLLFEQYYYPGWQAWVDDKKVEIFKHPPYGIIKVRIPPGDHSFRFKFGETNFRLISDLISLVSWIALIGFLSLSKSQSVVFFGRRENHDEEKLGL